MPESKAWRMGQLLQTWSRLESLSIPGQIHHDPAAPVAMQEAQAARSGGLTRYPDEFFYQEMRLIRLPQLPQGLPWAKA
jgi:hypothetical protein